MNFKWSAWQFHSIRPRQKAWPAPIPPRFSIVSSSLKSGLSFIYWPSWATWMSPLIFLFSSFPSSKPLLNPVIFTHQMYINMFTSLLHSCHMCHSGSCQESMIHTKWVIQKLFNENMIKSYDKPWGNQPEVL